VFPGTPGAASGVVSPGLPALLPSAPIADAAASLPTPPVEVLPALAQGVATFLSPPQLTIPGIPGFGIPLPKTISGPQDFICVGTGWSAGPGAGNAKGTAAKAPPADNGRKPGRWDGK
jgi:hypothetical protein